MLIKRPYKIGDVVKVNSIDPPCYQLPNGLPDGATVKVVGKDIGLAEVEFEGKHYWVSMVLVDPGYDHLPSP